MVSSLPAPLLDEVDHAITAQLGLHFPAARRDDLNRGLTAAAEELGYAHPRDLAEHLIAGDFDQRHADALAGLLTVGETYFFRDPATFAALSERILPKLAAERRGTTRQLRLWSAGCSTGEEPYTLAICLHRAIPDIAKWKITLLATDLNPRSLQKAKAGVYGEWSFRGVPEETRANWFTALPNGRYEISPKIRSMVTFDYLNLVEDCFPALSNQTNAMDIILCRNVMMYFSREQMDRIVAKFHDTLVSDGKLIVSATEASAEIFSEFTTMDFAGTLIYRKGRAPQQSLTLHTEPALEPPPSAEIPTAVLPPPALVRMPPRTATPPAKKARPPHELAAEARALANQGRFTDALRACDAAVAADKLIPAHHYLRGIIQQELLDTPGAITSLQRALYLDSRFIMGYFTLGHLFLGQGQKRDAERSFANARNLLRHANPDEVLPESEGLTAGRLLAILHSTEQSLT